ncbi:MAG TPA: RNA polymerase sigma-54 factor [Desulfotomaculum sp.]|jgi:RNA polymerase sigma-54 factor|nr:RNA polymerase sigma-54 factor [Desulfotomaculum sp.]
MQVGYGLNIEQVQKLIMTPELRQAITVLQLSTLELDQYIKQQLQENPLLELDEEREESSGSEELIQETAVSEDSNREYDINWQEYFHDSSDMGMPRREREAPPEFYNYENLVSQGPSLIEYLFNQLHLTVSDDQQRLIGEYLIGNIDGHGYLQVSVEEVAGYLEVGPDKVDETLKIIQGFDPPGVGARTLQECLLIQIQQLGMKDELLFKVIQNHLPDLAGGKLGRTAQQLSVDKKEIQRIADLIKTLDPKPGRNYSAGSSTRYIVPDIVLKKIGEDYVIITNDVILPRLNISPAYRSFLNHESDPQTRRFVEGKLTAAAWLIRSIEQRRLTLYKVTSCLVELQRDFLDGGVEYLKPLNLKQVAEIVGLHESTVSRTTSNKYIQTPQGLFKMRYFFSSGLTGDDGKTTSAVSVKKTLREIVAAENPLKPLNDQKIAGIFRQQGIKISRRTIAKYRDELGIYSVRQRIRY